MTVTKMDFSLLDRIEGAAKDAFVPFVADVMRISTDPFVPDVTNSLAGSAFVNEADLQEGRIVYGNTLNNTTHKPVNNYAEAQYKGLPNKNKMRHPKATEKWDVASYKANHAEWNKIANQQMAKIARGTK